MFSLFNFVLGSYELPVARILILTTPQGQNIGKKHDHSVERNPKRQ